MLVSLWWELPPRLIPIIVDSISGSNTYFYLFFGNHFHPGKALQDLDSRAKILVTMAGCDGCLEKLPGQAGQKQGNVEFLAALQHEFGVHAALGGEDHAFVEGHDDIGEHEVLGELCL